MKKFDFQLAIPDDDIGVKVSHYLEIRKEELWRCIEHGNKPTESMQNETQETKSESSSSKSRIVFFFFLYEWMNERTEWNHDNAASDNKECTDQ